MSEVRNGDENNSEAHQEETDHEVLVLDMHSFEIHLNGVADNLSEINTLSIHTPIIEEFIAALESTTTLQELRIVWFEDGWVTSAHQYQVVVQLCQCLANLRRHNEFHPLEKIALTYPDTDYIYMSDMNLHLELLLQLLVATKQFGIRHMMFEDVEPVPVPWMVEFCRDHPQMKILELHRVKFATTKCNRQPTTHSEPIVLDKLALYSVTFATTTARFEFAEFVKHIHVSALALGSVNESDSDDESDEDENYDDLTYISADKMSSVEELTLSHGCRIEPFRDFMEAGWALVRKLSVTIDGADNTVERLNIVSSVICRAVQLKSFAINCEPYPGHYHDEPLSTLRLRQALNACATVTEIIVNHEYCYDFSLYDVQHFDRIVNRNRTLACLVASPGVFPIDQLLLLMTHPQLEKCPTGRYMLARCLPEMFPFQKGTHLFPAAKKKSSRTRSPSPEPMRKLRPRKCISYKV